jgi:hypothetical protein
MDDTRQRSQRNKRRERAQRMLLERRQRLNCEERFDDGAVKSGIGCFPGKARGVGVDSDAEDGPIARSARPPRPQPRKKREPLYEEDVIDGFSVVSFKSFMDLSVSVFFFCLDVGRGSD